MPEPQKLEQEFWTSLKADRVVMLGVVDDNEGHSRPMTAQFENDRSPIWFFGSHDSALAKSVQRNSRAVANYVAKDHELFAAISGTLSIESDRDVIDRLWNRHIAAWYEGGKDDPNFALFRLDAEQAEIWRDGSSLIAGIKLLLGADPKAEYAENVATVRLDTSAE